MTSRLLGIRLRELRGDRTLAEFSELVGVGRTVWSNYEAGRRLPSHETISRVADVTGVPVDSIIPGAALKRVTAPFDSADEPAHAVALWLYDKLGDYPPGPDRFLYWASRWDGIVREFLMRIHDEAAARDLTYFEASAVLRQQLGTRSNEELEAFVENV